MERGQLKFGWATLPKLQHALHDAPAEGSAGDASAAMRVLRADRGKAMGGGGQAGRQRPAVTARPKSLAPGAVSSTATRPCKLARRRPPLSGLGAL